MANIPFFISPPYQVPPIICIFSVRLNITKFSEFNPCSFQLGLVVFEPFITIKSGSPNVSNSKLDGRMNILVTKCACHATSIIKRTFNLVSGLVPQKASTTYIFLEEDNCFNTNFLQLSKTSAVVGKFTLPSQ